jgi:hypothetical protein
MHVNNPGHDNFVGAVDPLPSAHRLFLCYQDDFSPGYNDVTAKAPAAASVNNQSLCQDNGIGKT